MTFEKRLATRAAEIDIALADALAAAGSERAGVPPRMAEAMRHAVMAGGKRMRPFLVLETAQVVGCPEEAAMPAAVALELVHCYSLVHDDLPAMDNDLLRRGKPTVWNAFDEWTAILTGDALLTLAFEHLAASRHPAVSEGMRLQLIVRLAAASGGHGMVGGQCLDLEADKLGKPPTPDVAHIERLQAMKTGRLFEVACLMGAMTGGAAQGEVAALARFGAGLGAAFQLADDLLDVEGDAETVGKATAKDAAAGKATLIGMLGVKAARQRLVEIEQAALGEVESFGSRADVLRETLRFACARQR
jgi:farnesyl diphosphate synthase